MDSWEVGDVVRRVSGKHNGMRPGDEGRVVNAAMNEIDGRGTGHSKDNFILVRAARAGSDVGARKDDGGKLDMNLLDDMPRALKAIVEVMQWAIVDKKPAPYVRGSWLGVSADRYRAAIKRHDRSACEQATLAVPVRLQRDAETNLLHLAHQACSAMMALENTLRELEGAK